MAVKIGHSFKLFAEIAQDLFLAETVSFTLQPVDKKEIIINGMSF